MTFCPVPTSQRPLEEFKQLCQSWFFKWPIKEKLILKKNLFLSWLIVFPLIAIIETGSIKLRSEPLELMFVSGSISLILPLLITVRLIVGWNYIFKRLMSENIEYEESGWYDGQTWQKPNKWREQDVLVAQFEVKPMLDNLKIIFFFLFSLIVIICSFYKSIETIL